MGLKIEHLNVSFDEAVIHDLSIEVINGEFCTLVGHSGTGKSTILNSVAGLIDCTCERMILNDQNILEVPTHERNIGFVFQKPLLFPHMTIAENIAYSLNIRKWSEEAIQNRVAELLALLELTGYENRLPNELSGGQQQRVAIGRAMAFNPSILLMDEPFSSLDPILRKNMGEFLKKLQKQLKLTVVFVTHDPDEALRLSDKIGFIYEGSLIQYDEPKKLYNEPQHKVVADFFGYCNYLEKENQLMVCRPHHIKLTEGNTYTIVHKAYVGKSVLYDLKNDMQTLKAESLSDDYALNEQVNVEIVSSHVIDKKVP